MAGFFQERHLMKPSEFHIGLEFVCGPFWWRCTDVGTRTVTAIRLVEEDPSWYDGPPYMVEEIVLDETKLEDAYLSVGDQLRASMEDQSGHPSYPGDAVFRMSREKINAERYPRPRLLRFDRVRDDGEILHPYAARRTGSDNSSWIIQLYLPFKQEWAEIDEREFRALPLSTPLAVRDRASKEDGARRPCTH